MLIFHFYRVKSKHHQFIVDIEVWEFCFQLERAISNLYQAVLCGNRKLAGYLVEEGEKVGESGFNFLHKEVCFV